MSKYSSSHNTYNFPAHGLDFKHGSDSNHRNNIDVSQQYNKLRIKLESQKEDFIYKPDERQFSFYQICQFPVDKRYKVRKIIYNENGDMITYREKGMKKEILDKFLKKCSDFKFTIYPAYDLDVVGFPEDNEILTAKSNILNEY